MNLPLEASSEAPLKFIRDTAADEDRFGGHAKVAEAIADVINTNEDIKIIGLLGPWGSGKSTVVSLLRTRLKSLGDATNCVFTYDAWLHQSDPPRRSFLETLIHFLDENKLAFAEEWSEKLDIINRRIEDTITTTVPRLTFPGTLIVLSLFLIPFGAKFASLEWYKAAFELPVVPHAATLFYFGIACLFIPVLIGGAFYISWRPTKRIWKLKFWTRGNLLKHKKPHQDESILSLFMNRESKTNYNRIVREPEPSAIEFQDMFREVMEKLGAANKRLIIVVDNLDRLPESEALALWATIRSFFLGAERGLRDRKARQHPIVILPVAEDAIQRLYSSDKEESGTLTRAFMDKTFDLTFHVNRPVLTKWTEYLDHQMHTVFGTRMEPSWPFVTGRFYDRYSALAGSPVVTPRSINTLINSIATCWMQWRGTISFASIAYYCTFRELIEKNVLTSVAEQLAPISEYDSDWQNAVAAIFYGVPPSDAAQVLLGQPLRQAILEHSDDAFSTMARIPSFPLILHKVVEEFRTGPNIDAGMLINTASLLGGVQLKSKAIAVEGIWSLLRSLLKRVAGLPSFGHRHAQALLQLLSSCPLNQRNEFLALSQRLIDSVAVDGTQADEFADAFAKFWTGVASELGGYNHLPAKIFVPGVASTFIAVAKVCHDHDELIERLNTKAPTTEITKTVVNAVSASGDAAVLDRMILALESTGANLDWSKDMASILPIVRQPIGNAESMQSSLMVLGLMLGQVGLQNGDIQALAGDGSLAARLSESMTQKKDIITARVLALLLVIGKPFSVPEQNRFSALISDNSELLSELDISLTRFCREKYSPLARLLTATQQNSALLELGTTLASRRVKTATMGSLIVAEVIDNLGEYQKLLTTDDLKTAFVVQLSLYESFWPSLATRSLDASAGDIFDVLIKNKGKSTQAVSELRKRLSAVTSDAWEQAIGKGSKTFSLALNLLSSSGALEIPAIYDALSKMMSALLATVDSIVASRWFSAARLLGSDAREILLKNLRDMVNSGASIADAAALFGAGGATFLKEGHFGDEADDSVRHVVLPLLDNPHGLKVLLELQVEFRDWMESCPDTTRAFLVERMDALQRIASEENSKDYDELRASWSFAGFLAEKKEE